jgi:hypothetical protein
MEYDLGNEFGNSIWQTFNEIQIQIIPDFVNCDTCSAISLATRFISAIS